jgi:hypothetical protein
MITLSLTFGANFSLDDNIDVIIGLDENSALKTWYYHLAG